MRNLANLQSNINQKQIDVQNNLAITSMTNQDKMWWNKKGSNTILIFPEILIGFLFKKDVCKRIPSNT